MIDGGLEKRPKGLLSLSLALILKITPARFHIRVSLPRNPRSLSELLINSCNMRRINTTAKLVASRSQPHLHLQTRPTDIFRDLHHGETRNAVHLEGGLNRRGASPHENANCISPPLTTRALGHYFMVIGWVLKCGAYLPGGFSVSLATAITLPPSPPSSSPRIVPPVIDLCLLGT